MASTTHPEFNANTEALDVAKAFAQGISQKTVLVTGVNRGGIGFTTAEAFASQGPAHLIIASRTKSKIQDSIDALKAKYPDVDYRILLVDLSGQRSVRDAAKELLSWTDVPTVDLVVNSAAVMGIPERTITAEGIELTFATNHIGHFLLTSLIMPKIIKAAENSPKGAARIVNVSSLSPTVAKMRWSDPNFDRINKDLPEEEQPNYGMMKVWGYTDVENMSYVPLEGYNQAKIANVLFSVAVNQRLFDKYGILSFAVHPGVIQTELGRSFAPETLDAVGQMAKAGFFEFKTIGAGSSTGLVAALDPKLGAPKTTNGTENYGVFFVDCQISDRALPTSVSSAAAERLWNRSEELVNEKFAW